MVSDGPPSPRAICAGAHHKPEKVDENLCPRRKQAGARKRGKDVSLAARLAKFHFPPGCEPFWPDFRVN